VASAGVPPIALVDWEDVETLAAVADGASGLVRPEPPVPVEQLVFRGVSAGVKLGGDGVILREPRPLAVALDRPATDQSLGELDFAKGRQGGAFRCAGRRLPLHHLADLLFRLFHDLLGVAKQDVRVPNT
jgi:hypothetical protein